MTNQLITYFLLYFFYSVIGYIMEVIICSLQKRKFIDRGFLKGPYCPIYGTGALIIYFFFKPFMAYPIVIFLLGTIFLTMIEYATALILEKIFNRRWWNYKKNDANFQGRICLSNALYFGFGALIAVYFINPFLIKIILSINISIRYILAIIIIIIMMIDSIIAINKYWQNKK